MNSTDAVYRSLGKLIRGRRLDAKLTQGELAERVGLTRVSITQIERGRQKVLIHTLYVIAEALGVNANALLPPLVTNERPYCQICGFDFEAVYGEGRKHYNDAYHVKRASRKKASKKGKDGSALRLCPNCHRFLELNPQLTTEDLSRLVHRGVDGRQELQSK